MKKYIKRALLLCLLPGVWLVSGYYFVFDVVSGRLDDMSWKFWK